jgi:hypothetical protein
MEDQESKLFSSPFLFQPWREAAYLYASFFLGWFSSLAHAIFIFCAVNKDAQ